MKALRSIGAIALMTVLGACSASQGDVGGELADETQSVSEPIIGGSKATAYPEAALIDMNGSACSGAVIGPKVVLTAGHCIAGSSTWRVTAPYANPRQTSSTTRAVVYDWRNSGNTVDPNLHDVGLVLLSTPINLARYPKVSNRKLADGSTLVNIGRINNGSFSSTDLFVSKPQTIRDATSSGYPFDYISSEVIQPGDSGGPCEVPGSADHEIAAVNSGAGGGTQVLARVDLLYNWIMQQCNANGGCPGGGGNPPPPPPPPPPDGGGGGGNCSMQESEPNNSYTTADALSGTACGNLASSSDQDWYTWSVGSSPVNYNIQLKGGDAQIKMWKNVGGQYYEVANTTSTSFVKTSNGAGTYVIAVWSASGGVQSYTLSLAK